MTPSEITKIIEQEINGHWSIANAHGVNLKKCLVIPPIEQVLEDRSGIENKGKIRLWLVLEEVPEDKSGYKIVYDERANLFGLADTLGFIGYYGTFVETLKAM